MTRHDTHKSQSDLTLVGSRLRKIEGLDKSTGRAVYTDDVQLPGMLHGKILWSAHPHAEIASIDTSAAEAMDGTVLVVTAKDIPGENLAGIIQLDQPAVLDPWP